MGRCRSLFGDVLLSASSVDLVALRHQGVADFGVEKYIGNADENGLLVCLVVIVYLVFCVIGESTFGISIDSQTSLDNKINQINQMNQKTSQFNELINRPSAFFAKT